MDPNVSQISAGHESECPDSDQDMLDGQDNAGDGLVAEGDGQAEGSHEPVKEVDGGAPEVEGQVAEHEQTGQTREGDQTTALELRHEGDGREEEGDSMVEDGVVLFTIDGAWQQVPRKHWAWTPLPQRTTYRRCGLGCCAYPFDCSTKWHGKVDWAYNSVDWIPQLMCRPARIRDIPQSKAPRSHFHARRDLASLGAQIPPELFPLLYGWMDGKLARTCRRVCRYWEEQCRERAFASINLYRSEKKVLELVRFKYDPAWQHIPSLTKELEDTPIYTHKSKQPWLHLLDPRWRSDWTTIQGPFPGRQTIRFIHFALPRSLPPSFSRGITKLRLVQVNFCRFEDTIRLVSELPDLVYLKLKGVKWKESLPTELQYRRPRFDRTELRCIKFRDCEAGEGAESPSFLLAGFSLLLNVYPISSHFSVDVVTIIDALLRIVAFKGKITTLICPTGDIPGVRNNEIIFSTVGEDILAFRPPEKPEKSTGDSFVFLNLTHPDVKVPDHDLDKWTALDTAIVSMLQRPRFLFAFSDRKHMLRFSFDVVNEKLTSLSTGGEVRYVMARKEERKGGLQERAYWYQATPESEELKGEGVWNPLKVYN